MESQQQKPKQPETDASPCLSGTDQDARENRQQRPIKPLRGLAETRANLKAKMSKLYTSHRPLCSTRPYEPTSRKITLRLRARPRLREFTRLCEAHTNTHQQANKPTRPYCAFGHTTATMLQTGPRGYCVYYKAAVGSAETSASSTVALVLPELRSRPPFCPPPPLPRRPWRALVLRSTTCPPNARRTAHECFGIVFFLSSGVTI